MFTGKQWIGVTSIGVISFSGGAVLGRFLTKRKYEPEIQAYDALLRGYYREQIGKITSTREDETGITVEAEISPDAAAAIASHPSYEGLRIVKDIPTGDLREIYGPMPGQPGFSRRRVSFPVETVDDAAPVEVVEASIFPPATDDWDYEAELNTRENKEIYTIHRDEFFNDEMHFKQGCVTYYRGDDILVDELQKPIYNYPSLIGDVLDFGRGSGGDPNAFYVRNERERAEFEVILDEGLYAVEVMGLEIEDEYKEQDLKHSAIRRFEME